MEDFYRTLGTNEQAVKYDLINNKKRTTAQILEFIRDKYEYQKRSIKNSIDIAKTKGDQNRLRELQKDEEELEVAYKTIKVYILKEKDGVLTNSSNSRESRNEQIVGRRENDDKEVDFKARLAVGKPQSSMENKESNREEQLVIQIKDPYKILYFMEKSLKNRTPEQNDEALRKKKEQLINAALINLKKATDFYTKMKIELEIRQIEVAYEAVSTKEKRTKSQEEKQTNASVHLYDKHGRKPENRNEGEENVI